MSETSFDRMRTAMAAPSRRAALTLAAAVAAALVAVELPALAQQKAATPAKDAAAATDDIAKPGPRGDIVIGKADAPVTIVEYASMTCPHCATFHNTVLPGIKAKYVDSGQVRVVFREFPLDNVAAAVSMLARCAPAEKSADVVGKFFETQEQWAFVRGSPLPGMLKVAETVGFTKDSFDKCIGDQKLLDDVVAVGERGRKSFGVNSTPTFFVNGKKLDGRGDLASFEAAIEPLLSK